MVWASNSQNFAHKWDRKLSCLAKFNIYKKSLIDTYHFMMINVWKELALEPQTWPGSNRSLQQVTWHKNYVMAHKMSSWHSLSRSNITIECKRSCVEMMNEKPNYANLEQFYLVGCLNTPAMTLSPLFLSLFPFLLTFIPN